MILKFGVDLFQDRVHELSVGMHMSIIFFEGTVAYHISEILEGDITIKMIRSNILFYPGAGQNVPRSYKRSGATIAVVDPHP